MVTAAQADAFLAAMQPIASLTMNVQLHIRTFSSLTLAIILISAKLLSVHP
jgi:hypothetical protein